MTKGRSTRGRGVQGKPGRRESTDEAWQRIEPLLPRQAHGGFDTKLHLVTDVNGVPLGALVTAGQSHESASFEALMNTVHIRRRRPDTVAGDKGYRYPRIRKWLSRRGIEAVIPGRSNHPRESLNKRKDRRRNVVERCIGWLKCCRRIATRYEKLAMIQRCLRLLDSSDRT